MAAVVVNALERVGYLAHAKLPVHERRLERTREIISDGLARCENPYVAFSAGKDSAAMLWLVLERKPDVSVRILSSGETRILHRNFDVVLDWWRKRFPEMDMREILIDRVFSEEWKDADWHESRKAGRDDIQKTMSESGSFDGSFVGMRKDESPRRKKSLGKYGPIHTYTKPVNSRTMTRICPIADWKTEDVGAMCLTRGLPLLWAYEGGLENRTTLRLTGTSFRSNTLEKLREEDFEAYLALLERFPELSTAPRGKGQV